METLEWLQLRWGQSWGIRRLCLPSVDGAGAAGLGVRGQGHSLCAGATSQQAGSKEATRAPGQGAQAPRMLRLLTCQLSPLIVTNLSGPGLLSTPHPCNSWLSWTGRMHL